MNKTCLKLLTLGVLVAGICRSLAHDVIVPCWRGSEGATYQQWGFLTSANPAGPDNVTNSYGTPSATINLGPFSDGHRPSYSTSTNLGFWDMGQAGNISLQIPNRPGAPVKSSKYIWVQVSHMIGGPLNYATTAIPGATYLGGQQVLVEQFGLNGDSIYVDQTMWRLEPNPSSETITITAPTGGALIDQVIVDTICITNATTYVDAAYTAADCTSVGWPNTVTPIDKPMGLLAFADIQTAVSRTPTNGTVNVAGGDYFETVSVGRAVTLSLAPTTGIVSVYGGLTLGSATLAMDIAGTTAGTQHDQLNVAGAVNLSGSTLSLTCNTTLSVGNTISLVNKLNSGAITGTLVGWPEGATNLVGGQQFKITYVGGNGNDVVLTMVNHAPVPLALIAETDENQPATVMTAKFLFGATDPDLGDVVSFAGVLPTSAQGGTVVSNASGATYTPPANWSGTDQFYFLLTDGKAVSTGAVTVTVRPAGAGTFNMLPLTFDGNNHPIVRFAGILGHTYEVQRSVDSAAGPWTPLSPTITLPTSGSVIGEYVDTSVFGAAFYRTRHVSGP